MKYSVISDLHIKNWSGPIYKNNISRKLYDILQCIEQVCNYSLNNNIKNIICSGDIGDLKGIFHTKAYILLIDIMKKYKDIHWHVIPGNHDVSMYNQDQNSAEVLSSLENVSVYSKETIVDNILFVPWSSSMVEIIDNDKSNCDILVSHFGLNEAQVRSGMSICSSITLKHLRKYRTVILGHYHLPQSLGNVHYVGSPVQLSRGESGEDKRFLVLDSNTCEVESIPFIGYMKYHDIVIDDENNAPEKLELAKSLSEQGDYVTVRKRIDFIIPSESGVTVLDECVDNNSQLRGISSSMNIKDQMITYMAINNISTDDQQLYLNTFNKYMVEVERVE